MGKDPTENKVTLKYSTDPKEDNPNNPIEETVDGESPTTRTYTTGLTITDFFKKEDGSIIAMTGAKFGLTGEGLNVVLTVAEE